MLGSPSGEPQKRPSRSSSVNQYTLQAKDNSNNTRPQYKGWSTAQTRETLTDTDIPTPRTELKPNPHLNRLHVQHDWYCLASTNYLEFVSIGLG